MRYLTFRFFTLVLLISACRGNVKTTPAPVPAEEVVQITASAPPHVGAVATPSARPAVMPSIPAEAAEGAGEQRETMAGIAPETGQAPWPTEGWPTSTPEEQGIDSEQLATMLASI